MRKLTNIIISTAALVLLSNGIVSKVFAQSIVKVDGSSTVYPITEAVAEEFQAFKKGSVHVTVGISGTGGGFKKFCRGEIDVAGASRPIKAKEMASCREGSIRYIELPVAYDALTVVIHPSNTWATSMTPLDLKKIWEPSAQGVITRWNQVRSEWPDKPITLFGPGADSGTFDYFTEAVVEKSKASRGDYTASEDDNVLVQGVASDPNALGYFGFAYYIANATRLKAVAIDNGNGPVLPSGQSVENATYQPLSRPIFIYVSKKAIEKPEVVEFVKFYLKNAPKLVSEVKYVPLPSVTYGAILQRLERVQFGTSFSGAKPGTKIEELLAQKLRI